MPQSFPGPLVRAREPATTTAASADVADKITARLKEDFEKARKMK